MNRDTCRQNSQFMPRFYNDYWIITIKESIMTNKYITGLATLVVIFSMTLSSLAKSPLIEAAKDNEWDKVKQLIEAGADVNLHDKWKMTPLHIAATQGNFAMVKWLIQHRADVNAQDFDGKTPWFRWEMAGITNLEVARIVWLPRDFSLLPDREKPMIIWLTQWGKKQLKEGKMKARRLCVN